MNKQNTWELQVLRWSDEWEKMSESERESEREREREREFINAFSLLMYRAALGQHTQTQRNTMICQ